VIEWDGFVSNNYFIVAYRVDSNRSPYSNVIHPRRKHHWQSLHAATSCGEPPLQPRQIAIEVKPGIAVLTTNRRFSLLLCNP